MTQKVWQWYTAAGCFHNELSRRFVKSPGALEVRVDHAGLSIQATILIAVTTLPVTWLHEWAIVWCTKECTYASLSGLTLAQLGWQESKILLPSYPASQCLQICIGKLL